MIRLVLIIAMALAAMPAAAVAAPQPNPFLPQPQQGEVQDQAPAQAPIAPAPSQPDDDGIDSGTATLMVVIAVGLIAAIWFVIARDARRATAGRVRVHTSRSAPDEPRRRGTRPPPRGRKVSPAEKRRRKRGRAR